MSNNNNQNQNNNSNLSKDQSQGNDNSEIKKSGIAGQDQKGHDKQSENCDVDEKKGSNPGESTSNKKV